MEFDLNGSTVVRRSVGQVSCKIDDEVVALSIDKGGYFQLDFVGSAIWEILETPMAVCDLCDRLRELFDVDAAVCEAETLAFLGELHEAHLVIWDRVAAG